MLPVLTIRLDRLLKATQEIPGSSDLQKEGVEGRGKGPE